MSSILFVLIIESYITKKIVSATNNTFNIFAQEMIKVSEFSTMLVFNRLNLASSADET
jgi:hypothetical protein